MQKWWWFLFSSVTNLCPRKALEKSSIFSICWLPGDKGEHVQSSCTSCTPGHPSAPEDKLQHRLDPLPVWLLFPLAHTGINGERQPDSEYTSRASKLSFHFTLGSVLVVISLDIDMVKDHWGVPKLLKTHENKSSQHSSSKWAPRSGARSYSGILPQPMCVFSGRHSSGYMGGSLTKKLKRKNCPQKQRW